MDTEEVKGNTNKVSLKMAGKTLGMLFSQISLAVDALSLK